MTMFQHHAQMPRFTIGSMLSASLVIVRIAWLPFLAASLGMSATLYFGLTWAYQAAAPGGSASEVWLSAFYVIVGAAFHALLSGFLTGLALTVIETGVPDWPRALARLIAVFPQIVSLSLIYSLLSELSLSPILLAAASLLLATFTWIYFAVAVREGGGPLRVIRRNLDLTRGRRAKIFGLVMVLVAVMIVVEILSELTIDRLLPPSLAPAFTFGAVNLVQAFGYVVAAVGYAILSFEQDDRTELDVAQVFD